MRNEGSRVRDAGRVAGLLRPYDSAPMMAYPVSLLVNDPASDVSACRESLVR